MSRARKFYEGDLGLECTEHFGEGWVEYDLPGGCFAISNMVPGVSPSADAGGSIAFEVDDLDRMVEELKAKGRTIKMEPMQTPVCRLAVVLDPDGNAVTLHKVND